MLSDDAIENLIRPLIERQEAINTYILELLARRINEVGKLKTSDLYKLERLLRTGSDVRKINQELARLTGLQEKEIRKIIEEVAIDNYIDARPYYDYRLLNYIPFEFNVELQRIVKAIGDQTVQEYRNLSRSTGYMIRDLRNPKRLGFTACVKRAFNHVGTLSNEQGVFDPVAAAQLCLGQAGIDVQLRRVKVGYFNKCVHRPAPSAVLPIIPNSRAGSKIESGLRYGNPALFFLLVLFVSL